MAEAGNGPPVTKAEMSEDGSYQMLTIKVPPGGKPGETIVLEGPMGKFEVPIPEGVEEGGTFQIKIEKPEEAKVPMQRQEDGSVILELTVPNIIPPGRQMELEGPGGKMAVPIPEGLKAGDTFKIKMGGPDGVPPGPQQAQMVTIEVPEGAKPGQVLTMNGPMGEFQVPVPEGLKPGDKFNVRISGPTPEQQEEIKKKAIEARAMCQKAAEGGNPEAQCHLGEMSMNGYGTGEKDPKEGLKWFQASAAQGFPNGVYNLGLMYQNGHAGLKKDSKKAVELFEEAAEKVLGINKSTMLVLLVGICCDCCCSC